MLQFDEFFKSKKMAKISREIVLVKAHLPSECCNLTNFLKVKRKTLFLLGDSFGLRRSLHPYKYRGREGQTSKQTATS